MMKQGKGSTVHTAEHHSKKIHQLDPGGPDQRHGIELNPSHQKIMYINIDTIYRNLANQTNNLWNTVILRLHDLCFVLTYFADILSKYSL